MLGELCKQIKHCRASLSDNFEEQKKCWELLTQNFVQFQTLCIKVDQQHAITCNIQQCWDLLTNGVEFVCIGFTQKNKVLSVIQLLPGPVFINLSLWH